MIQFQNATRLLYSNEEVAHFNHGQLTKFHHPIAQTDAQHSSSPAKKLEDVSGLEPAIFLVNGGKVMLTIYLWPSIGLCNGATKTVIDLIYHMYNKHQPPDLPVAVIIQFDDYKGPSISDSTPSCVPICPLPVTSQSFCTVQER